MFVAVIHFIQSWKRYNTSLRELNQLGDRELADIGISRSDIPRVAWDSGEPLSPLEVPIKRPPSSGRFSFGASLRLGQPL